jgi:pimeloyl-ACP methyl ester carboxylesterase
VRRFLSVASILIAIGAAGPPPAWSAPAVRCTDQRVRVGLQPGAKRYSVATTLCIPAGARRPTVHVLVSGASYGRKYWDLPYRPNEYSYVRALTRAGYATLNVDRIGLGRSSRPPAEDVSIESNAYVIHELITALRRAEIGRVRFKRVVIVGHSLGVGITWVEAATYHDVDGVVVTDGMHTPASGLWVAIGSFYPAQVDPRFSNVTLPAGYLTTLPDRRGAIFYYEAGADPKVIELDEATKETATEMELATLAPSADPSVSRSIGVPVLSVVGEFDRNFCDIPCSDPSSPAPARERENYGPAACLEIFVAPRAGHSINLHRSAPIWYRAAISWSDRRVGRTADAKPKRC